jgi:hypothetical protein
MSGIGLLNEKPLHASLKEWYAEPEDQFEVAVDGFVIDIVRRGLLLEIQTRNLSSIRSKLTKLAGAHRLRLIYPIAAEKRIVRLAKDNAGELSRRASPKRGRAVDLFWEMVSIPQLLANPNFSLEVLLIREEEVRRYAGKRHWRKRGWVTEERRLLEVVDSLLYQEPADWRAFLPADLPTFTTSELAEATGITKPLAQKMVYCMRHVNLLSSIGKQGRAHLYAMTES